MTDLANVEALQGFLATRRSPPRLENQPFVRLVRLLVEEDAGFREAFLANDTGELASLITQRWPEAPTEQAQEVSAYLLEEKAWLVTQPAGLTVTAPDGSVLGILPPEAITKLPAVYREDGTLVERGYGVRPSVEAALGYAWYQRQREEAQLTRVPESAKFLATEGQRAQFLGGLASLEALFKASKLVMFKPGPLAQYGESYSVKHKAPIENLQSFSGRYDFQGDVARAVTRELVDGALQRGMWSVPTSRWCDVLYDANAWVLKDGTRVAYTGDVLLRYNPNASLKWTTATYGGSWLLHLSVEGLTVAYNPSLVRVVDGT